MSAPPATGTAHGTTPASLTRIGPGRLRIDGVIDLHSTPALLEQGRAAFAAGEHEAVDLDGITATTSVALALLLEWMDLTAARGGRLTFVNPPATLLRLAEVANARGLLPFTATH